MTVRPVRRDDARAVADLSTELGYPGSAERIARRLDDVLRIADAAVYVAESETGDVIGWLHVHGKHLLESDPYAEIGGLVVGAAARRRGAGRMLVRAAEAWARERGYRTVSLRSNTARTEARPFYESLGYRVVKTQYKLARDLGGPETTT